MAAQQQQNDDGEAEVTSSTSSPSVDSTTTTTTNDDNVFPTMDVMESVVRCTLAGLGGSIVGLSQQKRLESMRVVAGAAATAAARRRRSPSSGMLQQNLPLTWAISCMAFCSIIETCRWTSPSTIFWNALIQPHNKETNADDYCYDDALSSNSNQASLSSGPAAAITTVADFTIGGAIAGVAGAVGRRTQLQQRLPSAMLRGSTTYFGIVPGIALGFAFGILQATTDYGLDYAEQQRAAKM